MSRNPRMDIKCTSGLEGKTSATSDAVIVIVVVIVVDLVVVIVVIINGYVTDRSFMTRGKVDGIGYWDSLSLSRATVNRPLLIFCKLYR